MARAGGERAGIVEIYRAGLIEHDLPHLKALGASDEIIEELRGLIIRASKARGRSGDAVPKAKARKRGGDRAPKGEAKKR